jgi:hypothetical protein
MTRTLAACAVAVAVYTVPAAAHAQQALASRILLATVTVGNRTTVDVDVDDFVIEESGVAREIFDVHIADYPIVVLIDDSASAEESTMIREAAARFVTRIGERAVAFGTLSGPFRAGFDDDRAKVLAEINAEPRDTQVVLKPLDALHEAVLRVAETGSPFAAMVIVSARPIAPGELESSTLLNPILDSHVPVHVIARRSPAEAGGAAANSPTDVLREVSNLTRGQYTTIYTSASFSIALDRLADRLAAEMMIQFLVPPGSTRGEVNVGIKAPGARIVGLGVSR